MRSSRNRSPHDPFYLLDAIEESKLGRIAFARLDGARLGRPIDQPLRGRTAIGLVLGFDRRRTTTVRGSSTIDPASECTQQNGFTT